MATPRPSGTRVGGRGHEDPPEDRLEDEFIHRGPTTVGAAVLDPEAPMKRLSLAVGCCAVLFLPSPALGQRQLSLLVGPSPYDLSGTGTATAANLGFAWRPFGRVLVVEPNLGYFRYTPQGGGGVTYLFPEVSAQAEASIGRFRPYLGGGVGLGRASSGGASFTEQTLHGTGGFRLDLSSGWGFRGEMRVRAVDPFHGNTVDFGFGFFRQWF